MKEFKTLKKWHAILLIIIAISTVFVYFRSKQWTTATMYFGTTRLEVQIADTYNKQFQGLSNRETLYPHDGMLFPFGFGGSHPMVMRDMKFSIDFIWLNGLKVVDFAENVAPEPGKKEAHLRRYESKTLSTSVLEVPAGSVAKWGLKIGDSFLMED